ncbi:MAG: hypothetical protein IKM83_05670 [Paludibacteraceae bacterium]|nr:hypothetical protein [Paludibacteraceae bacterium]
MISASVVSNVSAQQAAQPSQHQWKVAKGDSVMIKRECQEYLTGERPSVWVWDKVHTVYQLGTKRFPEGVLLMNINSWICEECLIPVNAKEEQPAEEPAPAPVVEEPKAEKPAPAPAKPVEEEPKAEEPAPAPAPKPVVEEPKAEEPAPAPAPEPVVEEPKAEEPAPVAEEETVEKELAKGEAVMSQQFFKHNYDRFTIGVRGGASSLMHHAENGKWLCGGDAVLDLQYAHYWAKDGRPVDLGIIVGLGLGYQQSGLKLDSDYKNLPPKTAGTSNVYYTVDVKDIKETDHQLQLEIPVMFSLIADNGVFFNFGPKLMIPLYTPYKQTANIDETHISAYFEETGVTMIDEVLTGKYEGQQPTEKNGIQFNMNLMLTAEIGYEWVLKSGNSFGLGAYANYGWNLSYKNTPNAEGLFNLTAPAGDGSSVAKLDVLSATHAYSDKLSFFDAGIKLAYHFNFPKKKQFKDSKLF